MEREMLLFILASALFAVLVWIGAAVAAETSASNVTSERRAWWRLFTPVLLGLMAVAFLLGWALQAPDPAHEWADGILIALAGVAVVVGLRGLWRAWRTARSGQQAEAPIATVGLLRGRIVVSPSFAHVATPAVLAAARAHETAHLHARDPLRIAIAQLVADLQWPMPGTQQRLRTWLRALELRRDDEAVAAGADPFALAEGILLAARQLPAHVVCHTPLITGDGSHIGHRVRRLLASPPRPPPTDTRSRRLGPWLAYTALLALSLGSGFAFGEHLLAMLPGLAR